MAVRRFFLSSLCMAPKFEAATSKYSEKRNRPGAMVNQEKGGA